jgi:16S rRNA (cytidine1402-2'-O)-methyltransferase
MSGTLFVVATPIGNLEDVTLRALRVLRRVDLIAAEDTRRTARLLAHHGISRPTLSFHQHNTRARIPQLVGRLHQGNNVALVSDAGTPGISDPGVELVRACVAAAVPVDPVPGVSASLTAAMASGFPLIPLTVLGFVPNRSKDRTPWFKALSAIDNTVTFFETPHRIAKTMTDAAFYLGVRPMMVARELTKVHQEFVRGTAEEISGRLNKPRGEYTVVLGPSASGAKSAPLLDPTAIAADFCYSTEVRGLSRRQAISAVARHFGIPASVAYRIVENAKKSI